MFFEHHLFKKRCMILQMNFNINSTGKKLVELLRETRLQATLIFKAIKHDNRNQETICSIKSL